jgi:DNA-binding response OmpR family regulator
MKTTKHAASEARQFSIAIVERDAAMAEALANWVSELGHAAVCFPSATALLKAVRNADFSLYLLDWGLPDHAGIDLVRQLRSACRLEVPIILCTARGGEAEMVEVLSASADDFIVRPVRRHELAARIGAALRRAYPAPADQRVLRVPPFSIDLANRVFLIDGRAIELQNREYELALMLFQNLNGVVTRARIIQSVWGGEPTETSRTLDTHVSRIRRKLGLTDEHGLVIQSVYGLGYRLRVVAPPPKAIG